VCNSEENVEIVRLFLPALTIGCPCVQESQALTTLEIFLKDLFTCFLGITIIVVDEFTSCSLKMTICAKVFVTTSGNKSV
jgi:hypothetical protein